MPPLITNAFPFSLARRKMLAEPIEMEQVIRIALSGQFVSAWGHENTIAAINHILDVDIPPIDSETHLRRTCVNYWEIIPSKKLLILCVEIISIKVRRKLPPMSLESELLPSGAFA